MARPKKYKSSDEKIDAYRIHKNRYSRKGWDCDICDCKLQLGNKSKHLKSEKHRKNSAQDDLEILI